MTNYECVESSAHFRITFHFLLLFFNFRADVTQVYNTHTDNYMWILKKIKIRLLVNKLAKLLQLING